MPPLLDPALTLPAITAEIVQACRTASREADPLPVHITAVSKKHSAEHILGALAAGHRIFGENRVQEAMGKWPDLKLRYPDCQIRLIGPLQSNKASEAVGFFDAIETIDRPKIARIIADEISKQGRSPELLIQINTGEEEQKSGILPQQADAFIDQCRTEYGLPIAGLMCIPPAGAVVAPHFMMVKTMAERHGLKSLSMGMSADYLDAAKLGATHVRIGSGIFGQRPES